MSLEMYAYNPASTAPMALTPGSRLGSYQIVAPLGAGGMGEVYRARDTRLDRDVALKILPDAFAGDADRLGRFEREAKTLAALNHPHIAQIHGLEESDGRRALVMELVEGPTLADRIAEGAIPVDESLPIARQILEALEAAHDAGIVHRDLKPANIKLRPDGTVKVLDFGLAKLVAGESGSANEASHSPTITTPAMTAAGIILGTAAYMSPEQAKGRAVDKRADIWAFGCVLYEMLTGRNAFRGETVTETLAAIMRDDPALDGLPADVPAGVRRVLRRSLAKDPRRRIRSAGDALLDLDERDLPVTARESRRVSIAAGALGLVGLAVASALWLFTRPPANASDVGFPARLTVLPPADVSLIIELRARTLALSPDGRGLAVQGIDQAGRSHVYVRSLESATFEPVPGTLNPGGASWSPDGSALAVISGPQMKRVDLATGRVTVLQTSFAGGGVHWDPSGRILFSNPDGIFSMAPDGGQPTRLADPGLTPHLLPGGAHLVYARASAPGLLNVYVRDLGRGTEQVAMENVRRFAVVDHDLIAAVDDRLVAVRMDPATGALNGTPTTLVQHEGLTDRAFFAASRSVVAFTPIRPVSSRLSWIERDGKVVVAVQGETADRQVALSPDGKRVAIDRPTAAGTRDLWTVDLDRGVFSRVSTSPLDEAAPIWHPDGQRLIYFAADGLYERPAAGGGGERKLIDGQSLFPKDVSNDGRWLVYERGGRGRDIAVADLHALPQSRGLVETPADESAAQLSPNGEYLAFASNEPGTYEVFVMAMGGKGQRWQISANGGYYPRWADSGRELFYVSADRTFMAVPITVGHDGLVPGSARALFKADFLTEPSARVFTPPYDVASGSNRFLFMTPVKQPPQTIELLLNWKALLENAPR